MVPIDQRAKDRLARYGPSHGLSSYSAPTTGRAGAINDFIMNPLNWVGLGLGRGLLLAASSRFSRATRVLGFAKRPIHSTLAWRSQWNQPMGRILRSSLSARKKGNQILFGYSLLNPLENLHYVATQDWKRLFINYHLPIIGVPIYDQIYSSSPPVSGQPGGTLPSRPTPPPESEQLGSRGVPTSAGTAQPTWAKRSERANARSRTAAQPFVKNIRSSSKPWVRTKGRRWCPTHRKYDFCYRKRYGNTR